MGQADRNLLLVPTYEIKEGQTDKLGHTWGADDVYGLPFDSKTKKYVVEGFYVENVSRHAKSPRLSSQEPDGLDVRPQVPRLRPDGLALRLLAPVHDVLRARQQRAERRRSATSSTWRSSTRTTTPRSSSSTTAAATPRTTWSARPPASPRAPGWSRRAPRVEGRAADSRSTSAAYPARGAGRGGRSPSQNNPANTSMTVDIASDGLGDCKLQLIDPAGDSRPTRSTPGSRLRGDHDGARSRAPGTWTADRRRLRRVRQLERPVIFEGCDGFVTAGAADTWSNWSKKPTGWAFTNVSGGGNGLDVTNEAGGTRRDHARRAQPGPQARTSRRASSPASSTSPVARPA